MATVYKYGDYEFRDEENIFTTKEVKKQWTASFPELAQAKAETKKDGDDTIVTFVKRAGTKGVSTPSTKRLSPPSADEAARAKEVIALFQKKYANEWPEQVFALLLHDAKLLGLDNFLIASEAIEEEELNTAGHKETLQEYMGLRAWALDMIKSGVALQAIHVSTCGSV